MKKTIKTVLAGLLVVPALALGVSLVAPAGGILVESAAAADVSDGISGGLNATGQEVPGSVGSGGLGDMIKNVINALLFVIGVLSVIMLIWGGIRYTTSAGNQQSVTAAKNTILYAIIGLVVAIFAFAIVNWVVKFGDTGSFVSALL